MESKTHNHRHVWVSSNIMISIITMCYIVITTSYQWLYQHLVVKIDVKANIHGRGKFVMRILNPKNLATFGEKIKKLKSIYFKRWWTTLKHISLAILIFNWLNLARKKPLRQNVNSRFKVGIIFWILYFIFKNKNK
jgi:hypothetical protein